MATIFQNVTWNIFLLLPVSENYNDKEAIKKLIKSLIDQIILIFSKAHVEPIRGL